MQSRAGAGGGARVRACDARGALHGLFVGQVSLGRMGMANLVGLGLEAGRDFAGGGLGSARLRSYKNLCHARGRAAHPLGAGGFAPSAPMGCRRTARPALGTRLALVLFASVAGLVGCAERDCSRKLHNLPLNQWPLLECHDAATTYLTGEESVVAWTRTQPPGGIRKLLACGARALDWRPKVAWDGRLIMHHGDIDIDYDMEDAMRELLDWYDSPSERGCMQWPLSDTGSCIRCGANRRKYKDLVVLYVNKCEGSGCMERVTTLLSNLGVALVVSNCTWYAHPPRSNSSDGSDASRLAKLPNGGYLLVTLGCVTENYDPTVTCYGKVNADGGLVPHLAYGLHHSDTLAVEEVVQDCLGPGIDPSSMASTLSRKELAQVVACASSHRRKQPFLQNKASELLLREGENAVYNCYVNGTHNEIPLEEITDYLEKITWRAAPSDGTLYEVQALWQETAETVIIGELLGSSLLLDEERSKLNALVRNFLGTVAVQSCTDSFRLLSNSTMSSPEYK
eukprot:scaffold3275_cov385-Prasinococcus_capsulatus_cf.AAC.8